MNAQPAFVYLASQSPRRAELLRQIGQKFDLLLPDASEDAEGLEAVLRGERPSAYVQRVTGLKLNAALARLQRRGLAIAPVLCSDTTVALGGTIFGKPRDDDDAKRMLNALAGREHRVLTAIALGSGEHIAAGLCVSRVRFAPLSTSQIADYVASGEPCGKAGAYAVQGIAASFITHISGSYSGIMGLPLFETAALLAQFSKDAQVPQQDLTERYEFH